MPPLSGDIAFVIGLLLLIPMTIALLNIPFILRLQKPGTDLQTGFLSVSVLIPARNEERVIGRTLQSILNQTYHHLEIILLDDSSTDNTQSIARQTADNDPRFQLLKGRPLPPRQLGKSYACQQLAHAAKGDLLLFLDADVQLDSEAIAAIIDTIEQNKADMLTVWPTQKTETFAERLIVPLMAFAVLAYLPIPAVHWLRHPQFAAANGQCLVFRRDVYRKIGGHKMVAHSVIEDVALARLTKANGFRLRMIDGNRLVRCRMYQNWTEVRNGFSKNLLAGHGDNVPFLLLSTLFHWLLFVVPPAGTVWAIRSGHDPIPMLILYGMGVTLRMLTAVLTGQRKRDALLMPVSVLLMTQIALQSIVWKMRGKSEWKGRILNTGL